MTTRHPIPPDRPVDEAQSLASLKHGGLPLRAQRRIREMQTAHPITTSTLTPSESVVARLTGLEPISQVMGSSVYHVGYKGYASSWSAGELTPLTTAYEQARSLALSRMQQEAAMLRAHVVIDVRFLSRGYDWAEDLLEFTAVGTAVRIRGVTPAQPEPPVLTLLTADELWKLHQAGYWPVAIAMGNSFYYAPHCDCVSDGAFWSSELPAHSHASATARDHALSRFRAFAAHFRADGVVGVRVERDACDEEWESNDRKHTSFSIDLVVMGTAVVRHGIRTTPPRPRLIVDLNDSNDATTER